MKILLTGVSGFIGSSLAEMLVKKHEVVGVDKFPPKEVFNPITIMIGDLLDRTFLWGIAEKWKFDVILHFAAQARVEPSLVDPIGTYRTNVEASIHLMDMARTTHTRLILPSSEIVYGDADRYPEKEHFTLRPQSPYAASKAAMDLLGQQIEDTVVLRSGMGFGERSPPSQIVTKMILRCMDGKPLLFPEGTHRHPTRDVNYVKNFVDGVSKVLDHPEVSGVFNMGSGREVDMLTLAELIVETVGKGEIMFSPEFNYRRGEEGHRTWLDNTKAHLAFGYTPQYTLEDGLKRTFEWLRDGGRELFQW